MNVKNKKISQKPNQFAYQVPAGDTFIASDIMLDCGGGIHANQGAELIELHRFASTGQPHGSGVYFVVLATKPVKNFLWDNTGLSHEIVNGSEAALRIMGRAGTCKIVNVNFRCRKHDRGDDTGTKSGTKGVPQDWWKQVAQVRDADNVTFSGGRIIGPVDIGEQKNTAKTPQHVGVVTFDGVQMTHMPSITDHKTVGKIIIKNCVKIGEDGKVKGKWPDKTL